MSLPCEIVPVTQFSERPGSGAISFGKSGVSGTRKWVVPWQDSAGNDYVGYVTQLLGLTIAGPSGVPVVTYPDVFSMEFPWLYCQEVDVEGEDCCGTDAWGRIAYRRAVLTAKYMPFDVGETFSVSAQTLSMQEGSFSYLGPFGAPPPPPYRTEPGVLTDLDIPVPGQEVQDALASNDRDRREWAEQQLVAYYQALAEGRARKLANPDPSWVADYQNWLLTVVQYLTQPGPSDAYFQGKAAGTVGQPLTKIIALGEYSLDRNQVLAPDFWSYIALLGTINAFFFLGFPPWTLLFSGIEGKRGVLPNGTKVWDVTFKFHFNPYSWNHVFRGDTGLWEVVASNGLAVQSYWSQAQGKTPTPPTLVPAKGPLHSWLYTPVDFAPVLLYS